MKGVFLTPHLDFFCRLWSWVSACPLHSPRLCPRRLFQSWNLWIIFRARVGYSQYFLPAPYIIGNSFMLMFPLRLPSRRAHCQSIQEEVCRCVKKKRKEKSAACNRSLFQLSVLFIWSFSLLYNVSVGSKPRNVCMSAT